MKAVGHVSGHKRTYCAISSGISVQSVNSCYLYIVYIAFPCPPPSKKKDPNEVIAPQQKSKLTISVAILSFFKTTIKNQQSSPLRAKQKLRFVNVVYFRRTGRRFFFFTNRKKTKIRQHLCELQHRDRILQTAYKDVLAYCTCRSGSNKENFREFQLKTQSPIYSIYYLKCSIRNMQVILNGIFYGARFLQMKLIPPHPPPSPLFPLLRQ